MSVADTQTVWLVTSVVLSLLCNVLFSVSLSTFLIAIVIMIKCYTPVLTMHQPSVTYNSLTRRDEYLIKTKPHRAAVVSFCRQGTHCFGYMARWCWPKVVPFNSNQWKPCVKLATEQLLSVCKYFYSGEMVFFHYSFCNYAICSYFHCAKNSCGEIVNCSYKWNSDDLLFIFCCKNSQNAK